MFILELNHQIFFDLIEEKKFGCYLEDFPISLEFEESLYP